MTEILDESNLSGTFTNEYIFFAGKRLARRDPSNKVFYNLSDHLGTARAIAEVPSGQATATKCYDVELYPYRGERWYMNSCNSHYKFEGKEPITSSNQPWPERRQVAVMFGRSGWPRCQAPLLRANSAALPAGATETAILRLTSCYWPRCPCRRWPC